MPRQAKYPGYRTMTAAQRHNARQDRIWAKCAAIRRLTNRWNEQVEMFPTMREDTPLDMYLEMNYLAVMNDDLLQKYDKP